jgi:hypothetical protein
LLLSEFLNPIWWSTRLKARVPSFDQVARVNSDFLKNQNDIVLVKKKVNGLQPSFLTGSAGSFGQPSHPEF